MDFQNRLAEWKRPPFDKETQFLVGQLSKLPEEAEDAF